MSSANPLSRVRHLRTINDAFTLDSVHCIDILVRLHLAFEVLGVVNKVEPSVSLVVLSIKLVPLSVLLLCRVRVLLVCIVDSIRSTGGFLCASA